MEPTRPYPSCPVPATGPFLANFLASVLSFVLLPLSAVDFFLLKKLNRELKEIVGLGLGWRCRFNGSSSTDDDFEAVVADWLTVVDLIAVVVLEALRPGR